MAAVGPAGRLVKRVGNEREVAAVGRVHMDSETVAFAEGEDLVERVHGADGCRAQRGHHCAHIAFAQFGFEGFEAHAAAAVGRNLSVFQLEHGGDAPVGVVGLLGAYDPLARRQLAGHPEGLEVGDCAAGGEVAQISAARFGPAEHGGDLADCLDLHLGAGPSAVARMVVGVDVHGQRVGRARQRVRRLQHLPGVEGMEVGIVVAQPARNRFQHPLHSRFRGWLSECREAGKLRFKQLGGARQQTGYRIVGHGDFSQYHSREVDAKPILVNRLHRKVREHREEEPQSGATGENSCSDF